MIDGVPPSATPTMWLWRVMIILGWAMIVAGLALLGWECLAWLRDGYWSRIALVDLWGRTPQGAEGERPGWQDMRGLHIILDASLHWLGRVPLSLVLVLVGLALAWVGSGAHDRAERELIDRARHGMLR